MASAAWQAAALAPWQNANMNREKGSDPIPIDAFLPEAFRKRVKRDRPTKVESKEFVKLLGEAIKNQRKHERR